MSTPSDLIEKLRSVGHDYDFHENALVYEAANWLQAQASALAQRQEDIRELGTEVAALNQLLQIERAQRASYAHSAMFLKNAIEAMRTAGGSEEFQIAFDRAKELASAL